MGYKKLTRIMKIELSSKCRIKPEEYGLKKNTIDEIQIVNFSTGEELTFADFYSGTEEDFKNLVATKVKEDFENQSAEGQTPYYFAETAEDIYNTAYDYVSLDNANILFDEDKVTYYFYPYDLASYADGFQYYDFTYEEILGTSTLTR